jgi:hypothetical protein
MPTPERRRFTNARKNHRDSLADLQNAVNHPDPPGREAGWLRDAVAREKADFDALARARGDVERARKDRGAK